MIFIAIITAAASWDVLGYIGHVNLGLPRNPGVQIAIQGFGLALFALSQAKGRDTRKTNRQAGSNPDEARRRVT